MGDGKIAVTLGAITFSGEGEQDWLSQQLDKILQAAPQLAQIRPAAPTPSPERHPTPEAEGDFTDTLSSYIKSKGGSGKQVKRFLGTADWLRRRGESQLTTTKVSKALSDHHQSKLGNPADCLNQNVSKGFCEKRPDGGFYITPDGLKELGHTA